MFAIRDRKSPGDEIARLTATYVNGVAIGVAVVGGIAPVFGAMYSAEPMAVDRWTVGVVSTICFTASAALHWRARRYLRRELSR